MGINYYNAKLSTDKRYKFLPDEFYRNYYNYAEFDSDMVELEKMGIIEKYNTLNLTCFSVTDKGISIFRKIFKAEVSDKYVPLSKSKQKYLDYLHSDSSETFAEYNNIYIPKREYEGGKVRLVSTKYTDVKGEFSKTVKDAKISYKKALREKKLFEAF